LGAGVNNDGRYGRWAFAEFTGGIHDRADFKAKVEAEFNRMIDLSGCAGGSVRNPSEPRPSGSRSAQPGPKKTVETLTHEEASRKNIPTASSSP